MKEKIKKGLLVFLFAILLLPLVQQVAPFINSGPLYGEFHDAPNVAFSWKKWWDGSFVDEKSKYLNDNTGFRPDLIRFNNQLDYSLFDKTHSEWRILEGDNHCFYQDVYIYGYIGKDFVGYDTVLEKVRKIKAIQDTLERLGKSFVMVHTPCKAYYYPEYFPAKFKNIHMGPTNLATYLHVGDSMGVHQVDFNTWFVSMKNTSKELLYPRQGFHWSVYGSLLAADSMARYIEQRRHIKMVHPQWTTTEHTTKARDKDNDIVRGLNLVLPVVKETFCYPQVSYPQDATTAKPKVIYIGDSFLFQWKNSGFLDNANADWQIWYYFRHVLDKNNRQENPPTRSIADIDWISELGKADCIVLMYTSRNLKELGDGFIEQAYDHFYPHRCEP